MHIAAMGCQYSSSIGARPIAWHTSMELQSFGVTAGMCVTTKNESLAETCLCLYTTNQVLAGNYRLLDCK